MEDSPQKIRHKEDSPHGRFATEDSPQRRFATQRVRHTNVTENLSVTAGQTFATVPMRKIRHTTVIGWGWVGRVGVSGVEVGGGGVRLGGRGLESWGRGGWGELGTLQPRSPDLTPPTSTPRPQLHQPKPPDFNPHNPNPSPNSPDPPPHPNLSPLCGRIFRIGTVANVCPTVTLKFSVTFVVWRIFFVANLLWRIFHVGNPLATA